MYRTVLMADSKTKKHATPYSRGTVAAVGRPEKDPEMIFGRSLDLATTIPPCPRLRCRQRWASLPHGSGRGGLAVGTGWLDRALGTGWLGRALGRGLAFGTGWLLGRALGTGLAFGLGFWFRL